MLTPSACVFVRAQEPCLRSSLGTEPECGPSQHIPSHDWGCLGPSWVSPHGPAAQEFPQRGPGHIHPVCLCRCHRGSCSWSTAVPLIELAVFSSSPESEQPLGEAPSVPGGANAAG